MLADNYKITVQDLQQALQRPKDNARYMRDGPGIGGIHLLENVKLDELASRRVHEFAFVMQPLKLKGATGSTVAPIAVRWRC
jgi:hypothetical protein